MGKRQRNRDRARSDWKAPQESRKGFLVRTSTDDFDGLVDSVEGEGDPNHEWTDDEVREIQSFIG